MSKINLNKSSILEKIKILRTVKVNNKMQKNYTYYLTKPMGKDFDPLFKPELTPKQMLKLGIFGGKYFNDVAKTDEYPKDWFIDAKLCGEENKADYKLNYFGVKASISLKEWANKGWIHPDDPRGWVEWYFRYYMGRRHEDDARQIKRWINAKRHFQSAFTHESKTGKQSLPRLQALLHWAYDTTKHKK
jgi:hypothetical protein